MDPEQSATDLDSTSNSTDWIWMTIFQICWFAETDGFQTVTRHTNHHTDSDHDRMWQLALAASRVLTKTKTPQLPALCHQKAWGSHANQQQSQGLPLRTHLKDLRLMMTVHQITKTKTLGAEKRVATLRHPLLPLIVTLRRLLLVAKLWTQRLWIPGWLSLRRLQINLQMHSIDKSNVHRYVLVLLVLSSLIQANYQESQFNQEEFEKLLVDWIATCDQPFKEVEHLEFCRLLEYTHLRLLLHIPGCHTIKQQIMKMSQDTIDGTRSMLLVHHVCSDSLTFLTINCIGAWL